MILRENTNLQGYGDFSGSTVCELGTMLGYELEFQL